MQLDFTLHMHSLCNQSKVSGMSVLVYVWMIFVTDSYSHNLCSCIEHLQNSIMDTPLVYSTCNQPLHTQSLKVILCPSSKYYALNLWSISRSSNNNNNSKSVWKRQTKLIWLGKNVCRPYSSLYNHISVSQHTFFSQARLNCHVFLRSSCFGLKY